MKTIATLKQEHYYIVLGDLIENRLDEMRKARGWRKLTDARYEELMSELAAEWNVDADALRDYYEEE